MLCYRKDIEDHEVLVEAFHEYVVNVCQDYRCLGIVILQIYSMCVFPADECARLMRYQVVASFCGLCLWLWLS